MVDAYLSACLPAYLHEPLVIGLGRLFELELFLPLDLFVEGDLISSGQDDVEGEGDFYIELSFVRERHERHSINTLAWSMCHEFLEE